MGKDLRYRIEYNTNTNTNDSEEYEIWLDVPNASRHNEILGYIDRSFTKNELVEYIEIMTQEMRDYDYEMDDLAGAVWGLTYILKQLIRDDWEVRIRYD